MNACRSGFERPEINPQNEAIRNKCLTSSNKKLLEFNWWNHMFGPNLAGLMIAIVPQASKQIEEIEAELAAAEVRRCD